MQIEIGSDYHIMEKSQKCKLNIFDYLQEYNTVYFDSGRSALKMLLRGITVEKILMPGYICESVRNCFIDKKVSYYKIDSELKICWDDLLEKVQMGIDLLYLHFFNGYIDNTYDFAKLKKLQIQYKFLILEDTTHSFLTERNIIGDYCICSLRKWFPIPDGGVLYSSNILPIERCTRYNEWFIEKKNAMELKSRYLAGEKINKDRFLSIFLKCEDELDEQLEIFNLSDISREILEHIDIESVIDSRRNNALYLEKMISKNNVKSIAMNGFGQVPLFYTILIDSRDVIRKWLIDNRIYCPVHWPLFEEIEGISESVYVNAHELSIPIDQRYTYSDMKYIADVFSAREVDV